MGAMADAIQWMRGGMDFANATPRVGVLQDASQL
jgi:hypothetical protein